MSSVLVLMRWPSDASIDLVSQGSLQVFRPVTFAVAIAIMMLIPAFPATAFVAERRRGTLTLLLNSPTPPWQISIGKLLSNVLLAMVIFSVSLPALMACYAMGGISLGGHIGPLLLVLMGMAVQYSAIGLWISIRSQSADASLRSTYAVVLLLAVLSIGPTVLVGKLSGPLAFIAHWMTALSPLPALQQITGSQAAASEIGILLDRARPTGQIVDHSSGARRFRYLVDPQRRKSGIPWWLNPVMVKEFRTRKFGRLHWLLRLVAAGAIVSLLLTVVAATGTVNWGVERIASSMVLMQIALLLLLGPSLGANLIASEVESGGWQLMQASPISPIRILLGKLMSTVWTLLLLLLATLPGYIIMSYIQPTIGGQVGKVVISLLIAISLVTSISACVSSFCPTTAVATATSYAILLTLFAGTLLIWLSRGKPFGPLLVERALLLNPAAIALAEMKTPGFESYRLTPSGWYIGIGVSAICLTVLYFRTLRLMRPD